MTQTLIDGKQRPAGYIGDERRMMIGSIGHGRLLHAAVRVRP